MLISKPKHLKEHYALNDEVFLQITQFYNADNSSIYKINALLVSIKTRAFEAKFARELYPNVFLFRQGDFCAIYRVFEIDFEIIEIKRNSPKLL